MRTKLLTLAALAAVATPAHALTLLSDNFDAENGGNSALNYTGFTNFSVLGNVDLIKSGDYSITCSGSCVDLDGSTGPGALKSNTFGFGSGDIFTFSFSIGGSQRISGGTDDVILNIYDAATNSLIDSASGLVNSADPFSTWSYSTTLSGTGLLYFTLGTSSADNRGPIVDSALVSLSSAVPEPSTWAMMIGGFALIGSTMRRRSTRVQFA